jgi:NhaA family Na+:H+ antiporter
MKIQSFDQIPSNPPKNFLSLTRRFFKLEAAGGILLVIAAMVALIISNSPLGEWYHYFLNKIYFTLGFSSESFGELLIKKPLLLWINDGFMAVFFFLVGLEIKREILRGELSSRERALLPLIAAIGGMIVPALIYVAINWHHPENIRGWAIPAATDIAFALGVLALMGSRAPLSLKILLTAIAIIDDLGAILIIAIFYTGTINMTALYVAVIALMALIVTNVKGVTRTAPYILLGIILWVAMLKSGVHATIAGVMTALFVPLGCVHNKNKKPLETLEHALHPWVAFGIVPIFAFANAGISFKGMTFMHVFEPVTLGIIGGLVFGKMIGIFMTIFATIKLGICKKPEGTNWMHLWGVSCLCGIGFTMSLFIGELAFADQLRQAEIRLGVLMGSILSAILAFGVLSFASRRR